MLWTNVVQEIYGLEEQHIKIQDMDAHLYTHTTVNYMTNAPYLDIGGLSLNDSIESISDIQDNMFQLLESSDKDYILLKTDRKLPMNPQSNIYCNQQYCTLRLDLDIENDEEFFLKKIPGKVRNQIRKGLKNNYRTVFGKLGLIDDFYQVISRCWRDLGTPTHAKSFYRAILEKYDDVFLLLIYDGDIPVSAALIYEDSDCVRHPYAGTIEPYKASSVNNVLYWEIIRFAIKRGARVFDMGRSTISTGPYRYKKSWGALERAFYYYYFLGNGVNTPDFESRFYQFAVSAWKKIPLPVATFLGPHFIKKIL